jgi:hypothetical protein
MSKNYLLLVALAVNCLAFSQNLQEHLIENGQAFDVSKVHSADIEGDGDLDVFTVQNLNNIDWYENLGNGNFSFQRIISSDAMGIRDVNTGDFDQDGDLDVVSASIDDSKIAWYTNLGNGYFSSSLNVDVNLLGAVDLEVYDVNNDGKPDILAAGQIEDHLVWYQNLGNGQFSEKQIIGSFTGITNIKLGDIDNDGFKDILAYSGSGYSVVWWKNNTIGGFDFVETINTSSADTRSTVLSDCDGDGDLDVIIANATSVKLYKYSNGNFFLPTTLYTNNDIFTMASADVDNDGDQDFVYGEAPTDGFELGFFENNGSGSYTWISFSNTREYVFSLNAEDYNNDGLIDIMCANASTNRVLYYESIGSSNFAPFKIISSNLQDFLEELRPVDLDSDGDLDVVATNSSSFGDPNRLDEEKLSWYENLGNENFSRQKIIALQDSINAPGFFNHADYDGDGDEDILALDEEFLFAQFFMNDGNQQFLRSISLGNSFSEQILRYESGDIDGDGDIDVVASVKDGSASIIGWYENQGNATFLPLQIIDGNSANLGSNVSIELIDLDNDGKLDIFSSLFFMDKVQWYRNLGNASFVSPIVINSSIDSPSSIAFDAENDGDIDVFSVSRFDHKIVWHRNLGLSFAAEILIDDQLSLPNVINSGDFDGDGLKDLFVNHNSEILWYKNLGNGQFSAKMHVTPIYQGQAVNYLLDLNSDSKIDLLVGEKLKAKISWFENMGTDCVSIVHILNDSICEGSAYTFSGMNIFEGGTYLDTLLSTNYCDSIVILNLRIKSNGCLESSCNELYISEYIKGSSFNKAIEIYNPTSTDIDLSNYTINLYINGSSTITNSIPLSGTIYSDSTYVIAHTSADAIILNLAELQTSTLNFNGDDAISLSKNGQNIDVIGQIGVDPGTEWVDGGVSTNGMTLVRKFNVSAGNTSPGSYLASLYFDALALDDFSNLKNHSSTCQQSLCDSYSTISAQICEGDSYLFNGNSYSTAGIYFDTLQNANACDSIVTLNLSVNSSLKLLDVSICQNEGYNFNGQNLSESGIYLDTLSNALGCDSIVRLNLQFFPVLASTLNQTICFGESITVNGTIYNSSVQGATETFLNVGENGCDSVVTINLTVLPQITGQDVMNSCDDFTWIDGITYSSSNSSATFLLENASQFGCDSLVTLNLTINSESSSTQTISACQSFTWVDGITYTSSNSTASFTIPN